MEYNFTTLCLNSSTISWRWCGVSRFQHVQLDRSSTEICLSANIRDWI